MDTGASGQTGDEDTIVDDERERGLDDAATLEPGVSVGRFVVLSTIGEGGIGRVYAAYEHELDRQIALKLLKHPPESEHSTEVARVRREAQALAKINHPNVVTVYDVGDHDGRVYLAMEFVSGQTVRAWAESREPSWREIVDVYVAAGRGLQAVHEAGLVHRDVKPDNIMVTAEGHVRLMDFGLARAGEDAIVLERALGPELGGSTTLTRTGALEPIFAPLGANVDDHGRALFGLARAHAMLGELDRAHELADQARVVFEGMGRRGQRDLARLDAWSPTP